MTIQAPELNKYNSNLICFKMSQTIAQLSIRHFQTNKPNRRDEIFTNQT